MESSIASRLQNTYYQLYLEKACSLKGAAILTN